MTNDKCEMINDKCRAFSLLEFLAVLVIIGFLVTVVAKRIRGMDDDASIIMALNNMNAIKEASREFHRDFGFLPEEIDPGRYLPEYFDDKLNQNPEYATRFLCLEKDATDQVIINYANTWMSEYGCYGDKDKYCNLIRKDGYHPYLPYIYAPGYYAIGMCMRNLLREQTHLYVFEHILDNWNGPYLEANAALNATEVLDPDIYPADSDGNPIYYPVIVTPWANELEELAGEEEKEGDPEGLAAKYRKGKYYQILTDSTVECIKWSYDGKYCAEWEWKQPLDHARIICRGCNGLIGDGSKDARKKKNKKGGGENLTVEELIQKEPDPDNPGRERYVYDIGDDLVMFIFGNAPPRSPLDK